MPQSVPELVRDRVSVIDVALVLAVGLGHALRWVFRLVWNGAMLIFLGLALEMKVAYDRLGWWAAFLVVLAALVQHGLWWRRDPELFVVWWRAQWRFWSKYRWMFDRAIRSAGLTSTDPNRPGHKALIKSVTANEHVDLLEVRMTDHQTPLLYQQEIEGIRRTLGAVGGRAVPSKQSVHNVTLWLWKTDPLKEIVRPYEHRRPPADGDWTRWFEEGLAVAMLENGDPFRLDIITTPFHWLIAGKSRRGKSGAIWSFIGQCEWPIREKVMLLDVIDPAMGVELYAGQEAGLYNKFIYGELPKEFKGKELNELPENWMELLGPGFQDDVRRCIREFMMEMKLRGGSLLGAARKFTPSAKTPWRVLVVDEIATVMALGTDIEAMMMEILRQGLKFGFMVIGAVQDPLKDQVNVRDLFTYFTAFGGLSQVAFDKLFGPHAFEAASEPQIPRRLPGVAYTGADMLDPDMLEEVGDEFDETIRVRVSWESDAAIAAMGLSKPPSPLGEKRVGAGGEARPAPTPQAEIRPLPKIPALH